MREWLQSNIQTFQFADEGTAYVHIRDFAERLGLDWESERLKLRENDHWNYREQLLEQDQGPPVLLGGLPSSKVFIWLGQVDVAAVRPELRPALTEYQETSRQMTRNAFLNSDLLKAARAKENPTALEQKLIDAAEILAQNEDLL